MRTLPVAAFLVALLVGCSPDRPKLPSLPAAFSTLPLPPDPEYLGQSGSEDALMFTFRTARKADSVAAGYERLFQSDTVYKVRSRNYGADGEHAYYLEHNKRPLWIRIRPEAGNEGAIVELTGAVIPPADSTRRARPDSTAADTASRAATPRR